MRRFNTNYGSEAELRPFPPRLCGSPGIERGGPMAAPRLLLLPAAPISPVQGGLLFHGGEEGDAEMAVKGQIDDDIPGRVDVTALSADVLDHRSGCPSTGWTDAQCFSRWFYRRLIIPQDLIMQSASYAKYQTVSKRELISGFPPSISCTKYKNTVLVKLRAAGIFLMRSARPFPAGLRTKTQRKISGLISEAAFYICPQAAMRDLSSKLMTL